MKAYSSEMKLDAVIKGARTILEKKNFTDTAHSIFDVCKDLIDAKSGYVALLSKNGQENEVLFLEAGGLSCSVDPDLPMPIRGLREIAYRTHKAVYDNDFMNSKWKSYLPEGHVVMRNVIFAPLNIEGKTVGIMGMANKPTDFNDEDAEIATVFGELAAIALQNSQYIELLNNKTKSLEKALEDVKILRGFLPICAHCKKIRDDKGYWNQIEIYIRNHSLADFSHSICLICAEKLYPEFYTQDDK